VGEIIKLDPDTYPALAEGDSEAMEVWRENLGDQGLTPMDLDRVTIPSGGGTAWEVPTLEGTEAVKELEGIIVAWASPRAYWDEPIEETGGGSPPDCVSDDGKVGRGMFGPGSDGNPSGRCDQCPMNEWGSADGSRAKACKEMRTLYMVRPGAILPLAVSLPPTSIQPVRRYFLKLASAGIAFYGLVSKLALERVSGQFTYSVVAPKPGDRLDAEAAARAKTFGDEVKAAMTAGTAEADRAADVYQEAVANS
jgi:hypothetical protein